MVPAGTQITDTLSANAQSVAATQAIVFTADAAGAAIQPDAKYEVYSRVTGTATVCARPATTTTPKAENSNNAPDAPTVAGTTADSITDAIRDDTY